MTFSEIETVFVCVCGMNKLISEISDSHVKMKIQLNYIIVRFDSQRNFHLFRHVQHFIHSVSFNI